MAQFNKIYYISYGYRVSEEKRREFLIKVEESTEGDITIPLPEPNCRFQAYHLYFPQKSRLIAI